MSLTPGNMTRGDRSYSPSGSESGSVRYVVIEPKSRAYTATVSDGSDLDGPSSAHSPPQSPPPFRSHVSSPPVNEVDDKWKQVQRAERFPRTPPHSPPHSRSPSCCTSNHSMNEAEDEGKNIEYVERVPRSFNPSIASGDSLNNSGYLSPPRSRGGSSYSGSRSGPRRRFVSQSPNGLSFDCRSSTSGGSRREDSLPTSSYDATEHAVAMESALLKSKKVNNTLLITILPDLTSDEMATLRKTFKSRNPITSAALLFDTRSKGQPSLSLTNKIYRKIEDMSFKQACFATARGRAGADAYWAKCYYKDNKSDGCRSQLLIESLAGRSNNEMREMRHASRDENRDEKIETRLPAKVPKDAFGRAIQLILQGQRQDEDQVLGDEDVEKDANKLYKACHKSMNERDVINIIVLRSDRHLRRVLRYYLAQFGSQVPFDLIKALPRKSLLADLLVHIINGVNSRSSREAQLLYNLLRETSQEKDRVTLLTSRLVRLHWEPSLLRKVKQKFSEKVRKEDKEDKSLEDVMTEEMKYMKGSQDWRAFCLKLVRS